MRKLGPKIAVAAVAAILASSCFAGVALAANEPADGMLPYPPYIDRPAKKPFISKSMAKRIALDDAGVKKKRCSDISVDLRKRPKKKVYVVDFTHKRIMKYHYVIAARTGKVLSYYAKHV